MIEVSPTQFSAFNPDTAHSLFRHTQEAVQEVLATQEANQYHPRYAGDPVGLAVIIAAGNVQPGRLSPLNPDAIDYTNFSNNNSADYPEAWLPPAISLAGTDQEILGGQAAGFGRFTAFALAKANELASRPGERSYDPTKFATGAGRVGLAGGRRIDQNIISTSGLWEVHDDVVSLVFANSLMRADQKPGTVSSVDRVASELKMTFDMLKAKFPEAPVAAQLGENRKLLALLLANEEYIFAK